MPAVQPPSGGAVLAAAAAGEDPLMKALKELKEQQLELLQEASERKNNESERLIVGVGELLQESGTDIRELRSSLEAQGRDLATLRAQELHVGIRALRETLETSDKMSASRSQDAQAAFDKLRETLAAQANEMDTRAREANSAAGTIRERLQAQSQELGEIRPKVQDVLSGFAHVQRNVEGCSTMLTELGAQTGRHQQEQRDALEELRTALATQRQCEALRAELEEHRRREAAHEASTAAWQEERGRLQAQVEQLTRLAQLQHQQKQDEAEQSSEGAVAVAGDPSLTQLAPVSPHKFELLAQRGRSAAVPVQVRPMALLVVIGVAAFAVAMALGAALRGARPAPAKKGLLSGRAAVLPGAPAEYAAESLAGGEPLGGALSRGGGRKWVVLWRGWRRLRAGQPRAG